MINEELLDFTNQNLLDSNIIGKRRNTQRRRVERFSGVDYAELGQQSAQLTMQLAQMAQQRKQDPNVQKKKDAKLERRERKKDLKTACGSKRRPLLKKKRAEWDECVKNYMKEKEPTTPPAQSSEGYKESAPLQTSPSTTSGGGGGKKTEKKFLGMPQTTGIIVTLVAVGVIGFVGYKMFFANKGAAASAAAPAVAG